MSVQEILGSGGVLVILMALVQISPIKLNPWSAIKRMPGFIGRALGKAINGDVIERLDRIEAAQEKTKQRLDKIETMQLDVAERLDKIEATQAETKERLDTHIYTDDERNADMHRAYILRFNGELIRNTPHTEESFNEILYNIDCYEKYCEEHPEYPNNRAVRAIMNIKRVYDERMKKHDFL